MSPLAPAAARARQQGRAGEARDERIGGSSDELCGGAALEDRAVDDDADLIRERGSVLEVVGDEDASAARARGAARAARSAPSPCVGIQRRQRLVEQQHARLERERPRERDPLALAARQLAHAGRRQVGDPEPLQELGHRRVAPGAEAHVREHVEVREQRVLLEQVAHLAPLGRHVDALPRVEPGALAERHDADRGRSSPATTRSTVVLPAPDGPTSAVVAPSGTVSWTDASKLRRGWVKWTLSAIG